MTMLNPFRRTTRRRVGLQLTAVGAVGVIVALVLSALGVFASSEARTDFLAVASGLVLAGLVVYLLACVLDRLVE